MRSLQSSARSHTRTEPITARRLADDFGSGSAAASLCIPTLCIAATTQPSPAEAPYRAWLNTVDDAYARPDPPTARALSQLAGEFDICLDTGDLPAVLFAHQSYYATILRLLAADILAVIRSDTSPLPDLADGNTGTARRGLMTALADGSYFRQHGVTNLCSKDKFAWPLTAEVGVADEPLRYLASTLLRYDTVTLLSSDTPPGDLLKSLYQSLFPRSLRHKLGEYYTPDWLAEHVLDTVGYDGAGDVRLLDPACGSGTFVIQAVNRARRRKVTPAKILSHIVGFDINPLAVLSARVGYLIALGRSLRETDSLTLPVYHRDALKPPGPMPTDPPSLGAFDIVAGNPPWIFWNHLQPEARREIRAQMTDTYHLSAANASTMARLGAAGKDVSMLFFYVAIDRYLKPGGRLGFIVSQTLFQTTAADEFRRFMLPDDMPIAITGVEDWSRVRPFYPKSSNKTAVVFAVKGQPTKYPVPYAQLVPVMRFDRPTASLADVVDSCRRLEGFARPHDPTRSESFWSISDTAARMIPGGTDNGYRPRLGIETKLEGVFRVQPLEAPDERTILIENDRRRMRIDVPLVRLPVEKALVYPFVSGASISRWQYRIAGYYLVPHTAESGMEPVAIEEMENRYPQAYRYFEYFEDRLRRRSLHLRWGKGKPFYSMYGIGPYTFASHRVVWKRTTRDFGAVVLDDNADDFLGPRRVLPNGKVMLIACASGQEAHYLCGMLNAPPARERLNRSICGEAHRDIIKAVPLPRFDAGNQGHQEIAALSRRLHRSAATGRGDFAGYEDRLATAVKRTWDARQ